MRSIALLLGGAAALSPASAQVAAGGWEVHEADRFCYMWRGSAQPGGTEFSLAVDPHERVTIMLTNRAWPVERNRSYKLSAQVEGHSTVQRTHSLRIRSNPELYAVAADVDEPRFLRRFTASPSLRYSLQGLKLAPAARERAAPEGTVDLSGAPAALAEVRRCLERVKAKTYATARLKEDQRDQMRSDPPGEWIRPDGKPADPN